MQKKDSQFYLEKKQSIGIEQNHSSIVNSSTEASLGCKTKIAPFVELPRPTAFHSLYVTCHKCDKSQSII